MKFRLVALLVVASIGGNARAAVEVDACGARSRYDITFAADALVFERAAAPRRIELRDSGVYVDGARLVLNTEDGDRVQLFSRELRGLVAPLKALAQRALDLATGVVRAEARGLVADPATRVEIDRRISTQAAGLRARIAASRGTREWQQDALARDLDAAATELVPLLATDAGGKALAALRAGDLGAAADVQAQAAAFGDRVLAKIGTRLDALRPQFEALCPNLRGLAELQQGLRDGNGRALDLVDVDAH